MQTELRVRDVQAEAFRPLFMLEWEGHEKKRGVSNKYSFPEAFLTSHHLDLL